MRGLWLTLALVASPGCAALCSGVASAFAEAPSTTPWVYRPVMAPEGAGADEELLLRFAPVFVVEEGEAHWNRIGTPTIQRHGRCEHARVDPEHAAVFAEVRRDEVGSREVLQLVYRVHFEQLAFAPRVFFEIHRNAGVLVLVTLDESTRTPLVVTTVQSCGCYRASLPTADLDPQALPEDWPGERVCLAGETLPAVLEPFVPGRSRFVVHLRSRTHRTSDVSVRDLGASVEPHPGVPRELPLHAMAELRALPIEGHPDERASFFYTDGFLEGHVRGAWSPLEGATAGLVLLDPRLGMDKDFGSPEETGARFYTALLPWNRERSRLDRMGTLLAWKGWRTAAFGPRARE